MKETAHTSNGCPDGNDEYQTKLSRRMRRLLKLAAVYAMRHDNAAEAANEALVLLRAEFLWCFELLRSRQRQPVMIIPDPLPTAVVNQLSD